VADWRNKEIRDSLMQKRERDSALSALRLMRALFVRKPDDRIELVSAFITPDLRAALDAADAALKEPCCCDCPGHVCAQPAPTAAPATAQAASPMRRERTGEVRCTRADCQHAQCARCHATQHARYVPNAPQMWPATYAGALATTEAQQAAARTECHGRCTDVAACQMDGCEHPPEAPPQGACAECVPQGSGCGDGADGCEQCYGTGVAQ
jgi:hypothetical protein